jgi:hypothetical protein
MEDFEKIENKIKEMTTHNIVAKKKSPISSIALSLAGIVIIFLGSSKIVRSDIMEMSFMSVGAIVGLYGLAKLLIVAQKESVDYVYEPTNKKLKSHKIYINANDRIKMDKFIQDNDYSMLQSIGKEVSSSNMLHLFGTDDGEIFVFQMAEYVPHTFVPASPVVVLRNNEAKNMLEFINKK